MIRLLTIALVVLPTLPASAWDSFYLVNTFPRAADFNFWATENRRWFPESVEIHSGTSAKIDLESHKPHFVRFYSGEDMREDLGEIDFHQLLGGRQGIAVRLEELYVIQYETRTRTEIVRKTRTEERTKTVTKYVDTPETRTRTVVRIDPRTGRQYTAVEEYSVIKRVPVQEDVTYIVRIPYTEQVERSYQVAVPVRRLALVVDGKKEFITDTTLDEGPPTAPDNRPRYLGVRLTKTSDGALVTGVDPDSPATRLRAISPESDNLVRLIPGRSIITHVNGEPIRSVSGIVKAVRSSPDHATLVVLDRHQKTGTMYEAMLEIR